MVSCVCMDIKRKAVVASGETARLWLLGGGGYNRSNRQTPRKCLLPLAPDIDQGLRCRCG
jgi:hypothetical protein